MAKCRETDLMIIIIDVAVVQYHAQRLVGFSRFEEWWR